MSVEHNQWKWLSSEGGSGPGASPSGHDLQEVESVLRRLGEGLSAASTPHDVAVMISRAASELFPWDACAVSSFNAATGKVTSLLTIDTIDGERREFSENYNRASECSAFFRKAIERSAFLMSKEDFAGEPESEFFGDKSRPSESFMYAPIRGRNQQVLGLITFQSYMPGAYSERDLRSLQLLTDYCSAALQRCLAEEAMRAANRRLQLLNAVSRLAISCRTPLELAESLAHEMRRHFPVDAFFLDGFLPNSTQGHGFGNFDTIDGQFVHVPESPEPYDWLDMPFGKTLFLERQPILINRTPEELARLGPSDLWWPSNSPRSASLIFVPLQWGRRVTGVLSIQTYQLDAYDEDVLEAVLAVGRQIAPAVEGLLLTRQLEARNEALRQSEERFQLVIQATRDGIYDWHPGSPVIWRNENFCRMTGFNLTELTADGWWQEHLHPDDRPRVESSQQEAFRNGSRFWTCEYRLRHADGHYLVVEDQAVIERDAEGRVVRVIGAVSDITERRAAEEEVRRLARFPHENPHPILEADAGGLIRYINPAMGRLMRELQCGAEALLPEGHRALASEVLGTGVPATDIEENRRGRILRWNYYPVAAQQVVHIYGQDVTESRRQALALQESEKRFETMAETAPVMIWMTDAAQRLVYCNRQWNEFHGSDDPGTLMEWVARMSEADRERGRAVIVEAGDRGEDFVLEGRVRRADGRFRWVMCSGRARREADGAFAGFIGSCVDVTERREVDEILRALVKATSAVTGQSFFSALTEHLAAALDLKYAFIAEVLESNSDRARMRAFRAGDRFLPPFEYDLAGTPCEDALRRRVCVYPAGVRKAFPHDEGLRRFGVESYIGCALTDSRSRLIGILTVMDDRPMENAALVEAVLRLMAGRAGAELERLRSQEREARIEAQLRQAQKLESLGVLAGGIAHDFNNLLSGILGNVGLALMDLPEDSPVRELLRNVELSAARAADLTRQMLAYSGKGRFVVEPLDLNAVIEEMTQLLQVSIAKSVQLIKRLSPEPVVVEADATQIRQVIMNLITNASEAAELTSGTITISTGITRIDTAEPEGGSQPLGVEPGEFAFLEVRDTGIGMKPDTIPKIFDPFFTTKNTGRGLGLAATLGIIRGHRGAIRVESTFGQGTTICVLLPLSAGGRPTPTPEAPPPAQPAGAEKAGGLVLVADDEHAVRVVVSRSLQRAGYSVVTARDGLEAVELFRRHSGELAAVVLDLTMPGQDGDAALRELRRIRADVPVILMSGFSEKDLTARMKDAPFDGFLQKPFRPQDLTEMMNRVVK
ncbi:MAG: hypothetical protein Kow0059_16630 [Candidatus Sumerlaeia bacterium]